MRWQEEAGAPLQPRRSCTEVAVVGRGCGWERQSGWSLDATKKKSPSELLEILTSPKDMMKWIHVGRVLAWACFVTLSVLNWHKSRQVGGREPAQRFIQLSQPWVVFLCEGSCREEVLGGCCTNLMGMQVSPNSASDLARCANNETDLKLVWWDWGTSWIQMRLNWLKVLEWFILMLH